MQGSVWRSSGFTSGGSDPRVIHKRKKNVFTEFLCSLSYLSPWGHSIKTLQNYLGAWRRGDLKRSRKRGYRREGMGVKALRDKGIQEDPATIQPAPAGHSGLPWAPGSHYTCWKDVSRRKPMRKLISLQDQETSKGKRSGLAGSIWRQQDCGRDWPQRKKGS